MISAKATNVAPVGAARHGASSFSRAPRIKPVFLARLEDLRRAVCNSTNIGIKSSLGPEESPHGGRRDVTAGFQETKGDGVAEYRTGAAKETALVLFFDEVGIHDVDLVGGKNASLGEMIRELTRKGVRVPNGFATTAHAYRTFVQEAGIEEELRKILGDLDVSNVTALRKAGRMARNLILHTPFPATLEAEITSAYLKLCEEACGGDEPCVAHEMVQMRDGRTIHMADVDVAVRSSATAEDLPDASFAGQQETFLNVRGVKAVLNHVHQCFASLFTDRAISYRANMGYDHFQVQLSCGVQRMVRSDLASSGVMFTIDTESGFPDAVLITSAYGLGENVVQGAVNPDEFYVFKKTLLQGKAPILNRRLGTKEIRMVYEEGSSKLTVNQPTKLHERAEYSITDDEVLQLARWACIIEDHYTGVRNSGKRVPMDIEWAKDGVTGELFIVQARPETVQSNKRKDVLKEYRMKHTDAPFKTLITGRAVGSMIGSGKARVLRNLADMRTFQEGDVLVAARTDPDWEPIMKKSRAIVTDQGGRTCHAAIIARELGIPAIVGCGNATSKIADGAQVTVDCAEGEEGRVYDGIEDFEVIETPLDSLPSPKTKILMNVGNPDEAFRLSTVPCEGVGLARLEFIIANHIGVHPLALIHYDNLEDDVVRHAVHDITSNFEDKTEFYTSKLSNGIAMIAAAFYPKPVIVRMSDFKSNEYSQLLGGRLFEPEESNPMIGWRGASRYYDPTFEPAFALECEAVRRVREDMGLDNVIPMIPFCRTPDEGRRVLQVMGKYGLQQGKDGLQVYMMVEIPSNVTLIDQFCEVFDGFSIGSNDLTQLTLGLDRDSHLVSHLYDERNPAVKDSLRFAIRRAVANGRKIGICGQAPSDYPEFAEFLVEQGINSISLNADTVLKTTLAIDAFEKRNNLQ